jgi:cytochrome d ubiquinol oxidase subunit I
VGPFRIRVHGRDRHALSTFWIIVLNSWMQTPVGFRIVDGRFMPTDWLAILFNPSFPFRFSTR